MDDNKKDKIQYTLAMLCCPLLIIFLIETFFEFHFDESGHKLFKEIRELPIYKNIANAYKDIANALKAKRENNPTPGSEDAREYYENFLRNLSKVLHGLPIRQQLPLSDIPLSNIIYIS